MRVFVDKKAFDVTLDAQGRPEIAGETLEWDLKGVENRAYSILVGNRSYTLQLHTFERDKKWLTLSLNGSPYRVSYREEMDLLLGKMGLSSDHSKAVTVLKAPMPGKIASLAVVEGQRVKAGDVLLVLEAMKMENAIKSPADGVLEKVAVSTGQNVEKNQLLVQFG